MKPLLLAVLFAASVTACSKKEEQFESVCQIVRMDSVEENEKGETTVIDVELEWDPCPGDQFQVVRGGQAFAKCMKEAEVGSLQSVQVKHWWDDRGYYVWDVYKIGECSREIEPDSEGSYEKSQECNDQAMFGQNVGFECSRRPFKRLVSICPWMARQ